MRTTTDHSFGPSSTAPVIRAVLIFFFAISLALSLLEPWIHYFFGISLIGRFFALSWNGLSSLFLWQPLTYFWIEITTITLGSLINLGFMGYLLWIFGSPIAERYGPRFFLTLFLGSGIISGLIMLPILGATSPFFPVTGVTAPFLTLFVFWAMMNSEGIIFVFFLFPLKVRTLLTITLTIILLIGFSSGNLINFTMEVLGVLWGYLLAAGWWGLRSPYHWTHRSDEILEMIGDTIRLRTRHFTSKKKNSKVIDFETGEPIDEDELFLDAMLAKISEHGERSLSWRERRRLKKISQQKKNNSPKS